MPTSTDVTTLKINTLTKAQYETAVQGGVIGANEISILTDVDEAIQVDTMPTAAAGEVGKVYQFIGTTDANYTHGYFYECVSDGGNPATYSWVQTNVQPAPSGLPSQAGNSGKFLTTDGTDASWSSKIIIGSNNNGEGISLSETNTNVAYRRVTIGNGTAAAGKYGVAVGFNAQTGESGVAIGNTAKANGNMSFAAGEGATATNYGIVIGNENKTTANYAIQIGGTYKTNSDANTFKVGNQNGNYEMMSADGTIPTDRYTTTPSADGTYVPTLTISSGTATRTWGAAASAPVVPATAPTLAVADWSSNTQTITVSGVTSSNVVLVGPAPSSAQDYADAGIICTAQGTDSLTFTCTTVPSNAITLSVVIFG